MKKISFLGDLYILELFIRNYRPVYNLPAPNPSMMPKCYLRKINLLSIIIEDPIPSLVLTTIQLAKDHPPHPLLPYVDFSDHVSSASKPYLTLALH